MRVISFAMIREFIAKHADADVALRDWYKRTCKANWTCLSDYDLLEHMRSIIE